MPKEKTLEFSKIILAVVALTTIAVCVVSFILMWKLQDLSALSYIITGIFAELASATGFYYWKARAENIIKLRAAFGEQLNITEYFTEIPEGKKEGGAMG